MARTPEGDVKDVVRKMLDARYPYVTYTMPVPWNRRGPGDFNVCAWGHYCEIETKGVGKHKRLQQLHQADVENASGTYLLVRYNTVHRVNLFLLWAQQNAIKVQFSEVQGAH